MVRVMALRKLGRRASLGAEARKVRLLTCWGTYNAMLHFEVFQVLALGGSGRLIEGEAKRAPRVVEFLHSKGSWTHRFYGNPLEHPTKLLETTM